MNSQSHEIVDIYSDFRDRIAEKIQGEWEFESPDFALVFVRMFRYSFNLYKAIGLLLPDLYYEFAASMLRSLLETSLDLHWIAKNPDDRSRLFLNFTLVEYRKNLTLDEQQKFDQAAASFLNDFQFTDKKGKKKFFSEFSNLRPIEVAKELGKDWEIAYDRIYKLSCMYVHGAPGVILFPLNVLPEGQEPTFEIDNERTRKTAIWSMAIMAKLYTLFCTEVGLDETKYLADLEKLVPLKMAFQVL
jgi:hypothetical protein